MQVRGLTELSRGYMMHYVIYALAGDGSGLVKLVRCLIDGAVRVGRVEGAEVALVGDPPAGPSAGDTDALAPLRQAAAGSVVERRPLDSVRLLAPTPRPGKVVAIGLNYADHATEASAAVTAPAEPPVFAKFSSSIIGSGEPIVFDRALTTEVDFEAELAVLIDRPARHVPEEKALSYVFGYTCLNDVSARDLQFADGQWVRSKSLDSFCPIGPWVVTADEVTDPQNLGVRCWVSGELLQDGTTADMLVGVAGLISHLSKAFTLEPGDVIATGTPPGVGYFRDPKRLLRHGDEVVVWVEGIGELRNPVVEQDGQP
jgi:2-keto-4-pentenoate hydratase/2-oxohepta-3-ene-1,7-dioic acid hydratase in catechol pathway